MKQEVINKLNQQLEYLNNIEILKNFWTANIKSIEKITAYYFSSNDIMMI